jgi:peptidoglycan hydrolase-like protein with peptidoglycan-binding domain
VRTPRSYKSDDAMVRILQRTLAYWGLPGAVDGWYGPQTERRVRSFQRRMGVPVTGTTTTATWRALGIRPA